MASSDDVLADRRYTYADASFEEGDIEAAADLARQCVELAPGFAPGWFLLGKALAEEAVRATDELQPRLRDEASSAFRTALALDPADIQGAGLRLALLGEGQPERAMSAGYVRALFDEYAIRFDRHLTQSLNYRGPELLHRAVRLSCSRSLRPFRFGRALDLGCGTGLAGEAFRDVCGSLAGVDLSPEMVRRARAKRLYDELAIGDIREWLTAQPATSADLALAADVFVYIADLSPIFAAAARVVRKGGLFGFTVQAHGGTGVALGEDQRFGHAEGHLRDLATSSGFVPIVVEPCSTRQDRGSEVPGFVLVLSRRDQSAE